MRRSNNDGFEDGNEAQAKEIIVNEVQNVHHNPSGIRQNGCAACHVVIYISR